MLGFLTLGNFPALVEWKEWCVQGDRRKAVHFNP